MADAFRLPPEHRHTDQTEEDRYVRMASVARGRFGRVVALATALAVAVPGAAATRATPAAAAPAAEVSTLGTTVAIRGHGYGHGIGMSQWGAYGYAVDHGWGSAQILDHYYGGTTAGTIPNDLIAVRLTALDGRATTVVTAGSGARAWVAGAPLAAGAVDRWPSVTIRPVGGSRYDVWGNATAMVCAGSGDDLAAGGWVQLAAGISGPVDVVLPDETAVTARDALPALCEPSGTIRSYRGTLRAATGTDGSYHTVSVVPIETYLRGVVPMEMAASWGGAGGGRGMAALEAQAVAARSYAARESRYSYAQTCDSQSCQVYGGAGKRSSIAGPVNAIEHTLSDTAVVNTAGVVRRTSGGDIAYTMFAASSGGYTKPSSSPGFTPVADDGDATRANPYHDWSTSIAVSTIESAWSSIGDLTGISVLERNGLGADGGRVVRMQLTGSKGSVTISGDTFRARLGLRSDWFSIGGSGDADRCSGRTEPPLSGSTTATTSGGLVPVAPVRVIDTRNAIGTEATPLEAGCTLALDPGDEPEGATAVAIVLTVTNATGSGYTTAYACGAPRPETSAVQVLAGRDIPGTTVVPLGADGRICIFSSVRTDVLVDVMGWVAPAGVSYRGITKLDRLLDSRQPYPQSRIPRGDERRIVVPATGPAAPMAASVNLTATLASSDGYVTAYPCGERSETSVLNYRAGVDVANHAFVALDDTGAFCLWASSDVHLVVDLDGVFSADPAAGSITYSASARVVDTRSGNGGRIAARQVRAFEVGGASAGLLAQITVVSPGAAGYVSVFPCDDPSAGEGNSVLNPVRGENVANIVLMRTDPEGRLCAYSTMSTDLLIDVIGRV